MSDLDAVPNWQAEPERFYLPNICTVQSLLFMVLAGGLLSIVFTLLSGGLQRFQWDEFALIAFFVLWVILLSCAILCQLRSILLQLTLLQGLIASYGVILFITGLVSVVAQWLNVNYLSGSNRVSFWLTFEHVLIAAILAGVALRYLYLQQQLHMQQQAELASRIQALQSRIRPHFLFNSMNIIASLIATDPELAEEVVEDLADLFRATLSEANQLVSINQEIDLVKKYIHIEQLRLGERLQVEWHIDKLEDSVTIPHLSLQPLLENAIYHGIQPLAQGGIISVVIRKHDDQLEVKISNPCPPEASRKRSPVKGNKLALENLQHRLQAYYADKATLQVNGNDEQFTVSFRYPLSRVEKARN